MSHFPVMVFTKGQPSQAELEEILMPWHEFECTGYDNQYVEDVDVTDESRADYERATDRKFKNPNGEVFDAYDDRFYRDPTEEEAKQIGPLAGSGWCGPLGAVYESKDWGDGRGYRPKIHFMPEGWEEVRPPASESESFLEWAKGWHSYGVLEEGQERTKAHKYGYILVAKGTEDVIRIVRRTNKNAKWDWWVEGGRFSNTFVVSNPEDNPENWETCFICEGGGRRNDALGLKQREIDPEYTCNGCGGKGQSMKHASQWVKEGNQVCLANLDRDLLKEKARNGRREWFNEVVKKAGHPAEKVSHALSEIRPLVDKMWAELAEKPKTSEARSQWLRDMGEDYAIFDDITQTNFWQLPEIPQGKTADEWIEAAPMLSTFAVVRDGKWHERGEMGWWAMVSNERDESEWEAELDKLFSVYDADTWVTCIDCHI